MTRRMWLGGLLGTRLVCGAAAFRLRRHDGQWATMEMAGRRARVIVFWSANCPRCLELVGALEESGRRWREQEADLWIVDANDNETLADLRRVRQEWGMRTPLWKDAGALGDYLGSTITPEAFVLDGRGEVRYQGQFDDGRRAEGVRRQFVEEAVAALLAGKEVAVKRTRAFGCTRKRRSGCCFRDLE